MILRNVATVMVDCCSGDSHVTSMFGCQVSITAAGITIESESKATNDKHQNWTTAGRGFLRSRVGN